MSPAKAIPIKMLFWLGAKQISDISAFLTTIIISVYALSVYGNPMILGILLTLRMSGSVVGAYLVPTLSSRMTLSSILVFAELGSAATMIALAISPTTAHYIVLLLITPCIGLFHGIFHVALYSQVHSFVDHKNQHRMNGVLASMNGTAVVIGGIASSIMYGLLPLKTIFLLDAMTFAITALVFVMFQRARGSVKKEPKPVQSEIKHRFILSKRVLSTIRISAGFLLAARFMEAFGSSTHNVGFPIISELYDQKNPAFWVGWVMAIWGLGKVVAPLATTPMIRRMESSGLRADMIFVMLLVLTFAFFLGVFQSVSIWAALFFAFFAGLFDASTETVYYSTLQRNTRVQTDVLIGASYSLERVGMGAGILFVSYIYSVADAPRDVATWVYIGAIAFCVLLAFVRMLWPVLRKGRSG
ncbi:MAG: MFS transporter [Rhodobacteraceae bacterium]|nr:MFS transporter [Paracoccaceae bacterium]